MIRVTLHNEGDTERFARALASWIGGGLVIGLQGDLGAGKTTFTRYLVGALGGDVRAVASPTYTLQHEYPVRDSLTVEHWDLYRLKTVPAELEERTPRSVVRLIEWPERCPEVSDALSVTLVFTLGGAGESSPDARSVEVLGPHAADLVSALPKELLAV